MKYDFDEIIDRAGEPGSYSNKWARDGFMSRMYGFPEGFPEDRICYFVADMDYRCPPGVQNKLREVLDHGIFGYTSAPKEYYKAVTGWFARRFDWHFSEQSIHIHHGTHTGIQELIKRYTAPGDGILLFVPSYGYTRDVESLGRRLVKIPMLLDDGYYSIDFDALEAAAQDEKNTMIILIQPHNPTGRSFTEEEIRKIGGICERNGVLIVSDEVHIDFERDGKRILPVMKVLGPKNVITTTAINKIFNTAGLSMTNTIIDDPDLRKKYGWAGASASPFGIAAVMGGYNDSEEWVDALNAYLDDLLHYAVGRIRKDLPKAKVCYPEATYILWIDFKDYGLTDEELDRRLQREAHVFLSNGNEMDQLPGTQCRRMCLTSAKAVLTEAMDRIAEVFKDLN